MLPQFPSVFITSAGIRLYGPAHVKLGSGEYLARPSVTGMRVSLAFLEFLLLLPFHRFAQRLLLRFSDEPHKYKAPQGTF